MKHISEFDFSRSFPITIEGVEIFTPSDYEQFLLTKGYAFKEVVTTTIGAIVKNPKKKTKATELVNDKEEE